MVLNILGKSFRGNQLVRIGLASKFYGLGSQNAAKICSRLGFYPNMRIHELNEQSVLDLTQELSEYRIENELRNEIKANIALKRKIGSYAGRRHALGLPVHGQRTRTNARTAKRLNRLDRRQYHTASPVLAGPTEVTGFGWGLLKKLFK